MTPEQALNKIALRCRYDLYFLCREVLGYTEMVPHVHQDLCHYVESVLPSKKEDYVPPEVKEGDKFDPKNNNMLILMPRGTFKSSVVTIGFTLQFLLNEPNARVLIDSETQQKAKAFLSEIKGHLERNELFRSIFRSIHNVYPDGVSTKRNKDLLWTNSEIVLASRTRPMKEPSVMASGIDKSINGMHYDLIICDDLHSEKNVTNEEQITQVISHWKLNYSLLDPGKVMIVIGTRWHFLDLYQEILNNHQQDYNIIIRKAILPDGDAFFPERLSLEELEKIKQKQGTAHFANQYLNEPMADEDATFKIKDVIYKSWDEVKDIPINWYLMVDPSFEGPYSDYVGAIIVGMDYQRQLYVRHVHRAKMNTGDIIELIFSLYDKYKPQKVAIKIVAQAKVLMVQFNHECKRRGRWIPIVELRDNKASKADRIKALAPSYQFHHAIHIKGTTQLDILEREMFTFPMGEHDDVIDAYASVLEVAVPARDKSDVIYDDEDKPHRKGDVWKPRSYITNV